jgi:hypothetical protein
MEDKETAEYFEAHSMANVWAAKPSAALAKSIRERHAKAKSPISIRLVGYQT